MLRLPMSLAFAMQQSAGEGRPTAGAPAFPDACKLLPSGNQQSPQIGNRAAAGGVHVQKADRRILLRAAGRRDGVDDAVHERRLAVPAWPPYGDWSVQRGRGRCTQVIAHHAQHVPHLAVPPRHLRGRAAGAGCEWVGGEHRFGWMCDPCA